MPGPNKISEPLHGEENFVGLLGARGHAPPENF